MDEKKYNFPTNTIVKHLNNIIHDKIIDSIDEMKNDNDNDVFNDVDDAEYETSKKQLSKNLKRLLLDSGISLVEQIEASDIFTMSNAMCEKNSNVEYNEKENLECERILKDLEIKKELIEKMKKRIKELDNANIRLDDVIQNIIGTTPRENDEEKENMMES